MKQIILSLEENRERAYLVWLLALAALLYFPGLGSRDFWAPVEPRYAEIARVMFAKGGWIVPTANGALYTDKPILYFWLVLVGSQVAGSVNEWTVRLPSALSALGLVLTTYALGRELFTPRVGFLAAAILATTARVLWEGRWAHTDIPFTFFFTLALLFFCRAILRTGERKDFLLGYTLIALATLTKGLIGVALPGLILLAFAAARRDWRAILKWRVPSGALIFFLIAAPWFASVSWATQGKWLRDFVLIHHIQRYASGYGHREPFHYYFWNLPLDLLPWTVFAVPALFACRRRLSSLKEPRNLFLLLWFVAVFVFFSFSRSKRGLYLLPLFPPAAIFIASYFDGLIGGDASQSVLYRSAAGIFFNLLWLGSLAAPFVAWRLQPEFFWLSLPFALAVAAGGLATVMAVRRRRPSHVFLATVSTMLAGMLYLSLWALPFIDRYKSARPFAALVKRTVPPALPLFVYADTMTGFNFYAEREVVPVLRSEADLDDAMSRNRAGYLLIKERDLSETEKRGAIRTVAEAQIGERKWYLTTWGE
jgi:4-amino-4-deoxy-L-arabinose transferase-like glycosyltransferase